MEEMGFGKVGLCEGGKGLASTGLEIEKDLDPEYFQFGKVEGEIW